MYEANAIIVLQQNFQNEIIFVGLAKIVMGRYDYAAGETESAERSVAGTRDGKQRSIGKGWAKRELMRVFVVERV